MLYGFSRFPLFFSSQQLGIRSQPLGTWKRRSVPEANSLRREVGSRRSPWRCTHGSDPVRIEDSNSYRTGRKCEYFFPLYPSNRSLMLLANFSRSDSLLQIKIKINTDMPVQVDGEPWIQSPGEVIIMKSALNVSLHLIFLHQALFASVLPTLDPRGTNQTPN